MDPTGKFRYVPSFETNILKTFDRIRREQVEREAGQQEKPKMADNVKPLKWRIA
jgi:hypothetical protein